jgi:hypothetical protein
MNYLRLPFASRLRLRRRRFQCPAELPLCAAHLGWWKYLPSSATDWIPLGREFTRAAEVQINEGNSPLEEGQCAPGEQAATAQVRLPSEVTVAFATQRFRL